MGHCIRAIIGEHKITARIAEDWIKAREIELPQGFGMILCTIGLLEDIEEVMELSDDTDFPELEYFDASVNWLLEEYSFRAKLAYIETDYFGGYDTQAGVLLDNGRMNSTPQRGEGVINALLKELGVWKRPDTDEFDMLELGKYRRME